MPRLSDLDLVRVQVSTLEYLHPLPAGDLLAGEWICPKRVIVILVYSSTSAAGEDRCAESGRADLLDLVLVATGVSRKSTMSHFSTTHHLFNLKPVGTEL